MHHSNFVHLHLHTAYSLLDGAIRPDELIDRAIEFKMPAVAVTDHGNLFGALDFYLKALKKGVKPIIGCEVYVAPETRHDRTPPSRGGSSEAAYHLVLLAKNNKGYKNLCKLLSLAYIEGFYYRPRVDKELLRENNEGLIALSACLHGEVSLNISMGRLEDAENTAREFKEIFDNKRFYLEIQHNGIEEQTRVNEGLMEISRKLDIPLVATNDCHYLRKEDAKYHDILICIQTGKTVADPNRLKFSTEEFYFKSPEEMAASFKDTPEALENTIEIAERCNLEFNLDEYHLPEFSVPPGQTLESILEQKAKDGLDKRLHALAEKGTDVESVKWQYYDRLAKELKVIEGMGFAGYFLIVTDFIEYARSQGIPVGPGRGSAAGSLVAYSLGITNLDPIKYNLLFERFLNPDRISLPDIDIDFCFERRDEVIRYVTETYGAENVSQIITFGQMKAKAVIRDVGRVLDMPYGDVDKIAKLVPNTLNITLKEAIEQEPRLKKLTEEDPRVAELMEAAIALEGLPRHASTHAAGVVISNKPLVEYVPLYKGTKDEVVTTQFSMNDVEKIGLVKFDFLGLKTLTVIDKAVKHIKKNRGVDIDVDALSLDDKDTYKIIASGNSNGIFQLESSGMKELLKKLKPTTFEDLIAAVALYRPGPLQSGMVDDFINRKYGRVPVTFELEEIKPILETTYGVMVYQEQVMEIAKVLAGYTPGDADVLRKAMGKKIPKEMLKQRTKFLEGARKNSLPKAKSEKIFDLMAKFAGYGFNKSHSAAYALIAYQTAYLKAHYPVEFMAALMSSDMDNTDQVVKYINECKEMGIAVTPPDLNGSMREFAVSGETIRFGLGAVKNVGSSAIDEILAVREEGPFESLVDFLVRVDGRKVNKKVTESLIKCGALDFTGKPRALLFASLEPAMEAAQTVQRDRDSGQHSIFDMLGGTTSQGSVSSGVYAFAEPNGYEDWTENEALAFEKETLGFYFSSHPLTGYKRELELYATCRISELKDRVDNAEVTVGGVVAANKEIMTKKGQRMAFLRIEDLTGGVETIVFSDLYSKASELLAADKPLLVIGKLDKAEDEVKLIAQDMAAIDEGEHLADKIRPKNVHIHVSTERFDKANLSGLKEILAAKQGFSPVFLHLNYPDGREVVIGFSDDFRITPLEEVFETIRSLADGVEVKVY